MTYFDFKKVFILIGIAILLVGTTKLCWGGDYFCNGIDCPPPGYVKANWYIDANSPHFSNPQSSQPNPSYRIGFGPELWWGTTVDGNNYARQLSNYMTTFWDGPVDFWINENGPNVQSLGYWNLHLISSPMLPGTGIDSVDFGFSIGLELGQYWEIGGSGPLVDVPLNPFFTIGITPNLTFPADIPLGFFSYDAIQYTAYLTDDGLSLHIDPVPEPATILLLGSGLIGLWGAKRKFKK